MNTASIRERHAKLRAATATLTNRELIEGLELLIRIGADRDESTRCAGAYLIDELTDRSTSVRAALDAWEFDMVTKESSAEVTVRVARDVLYLHLHPDAKRAGR